MITEQDLSFTMPSLLQKQALPIFEQYSDAPAFYSTPKKPLQTTRELHLVAYAAWLYRLTNEQELTISIDKNKAVSFNFEATTTFQQLCEQLQHNEQTTDSPASYALLNEPNAMIPMQLIIAHNTYFFHSLNALLYADNETRYMYYYELLLQHCLEEPNRAIADIAIVTAEELNIYEQLNQTAKAINIAQTMHEIFSKTAAQQPQKIALKDATSEKTFAELETASDSIAQFLVEQQIAVGDYVAVYMNRSMEAIISMLGVMKAGGIYVPLSPDNPDERNEYIMQDTQCKLVIAHAETLEKAQKSAPAHAQVFAYATIPTAPFTQTVQVKPTDLAYIIYTSGSTGRPKGVKIPHKSIATFGYGEREVYQFHADAVLTQFYTLTFDASMLELCPLIFFGNTLYMLSKEERLDISLFAQAVEKNAIDYVMMVPMSALKQYALFATAEDVEKMQRLQCFGVGGEALPAETARLFQKTFGLIPLINVYGPTECSVLTTTYTIDYLLPEKTMNIPIGTPLPNYRLHILNDAMQYSPLHTSGELYIETTALAEGYLNLPEKTDAVFVQTPLSTAKMYRSGDVVRLLPNGQIEFIGRKDSQVKIRGFRVELGEIEEQLLKVQHLAEGAIIAKEIHGELTIIAYYNAKKGQSLLPLDVIHALQQQLPDYMIPAHCILLEEFPLLPSGKINRSALKELIIDVQVEEDISEKTAPRNEDEQFVLQAWREVLQLENIGIDEDFFEIGGHSLKVLALLTQLKKRFPALKINDFFKYRSIEQLVQYANSATESAEVTKPMTTKNNQLIEHPKQLFTEKTFAQYSNKHFFLTGATGYLGAHLLIDLLKSDVASVAVLVRASDKLAGLERIRRIIALYNDEALLDDAQISSKLEIIVGDFTVADLNIAFAERQYLQEKIDNILHCGADVRHFGDIEHFKKTNIDSTQYLIDFAKNCEHARFHYISTLGIQEDLASEGKWDDFLQKSLITEAPDVESLYTNSKLASEKLLQAAYENGLAVTIYRPGNISCQAQSGIFQKNIDANAVYRMFKSFILLKKAPDVHFMMDFTMVDYASSLISAIARDSATIGQIYNICNPTLISFQQVLQHFRRFGYSIETIPEKQFLFELYNDSTINKEGAALAMAGAEGDGAKNSTLLYACPQSQAFMEQHELSCPEPNYAFFEKMIQLAIEQNYFPAIK